MVVLKLALAGALLVVFLWKARTNGLFLLGIPVLMVMGESVFFDRMRPFWTPGRLDPQTHIMMWLFFVWLVTLLLLRRRERMGWFGPAKILLEEVPLLLIALLIAIHVLGAAAPTGDVGTALTRGVDLIYLVAGYLLVRGIVSRFTRTEVIEFLSAVVIVNTIAAGLYVVHQGLGMTIYTGGEYFATTFAGSTITRTFHFAPQFTMLALAFVLAKSRWTAGWLAVLAITVASVLVSYTRTLFVAVIVAVVIAIMVRELSQPNAARFARRSLVVLASMALIVAVFALALPTQSRYAVSRLSEFSSAKGVGDIGNWQVRQFKYNAVADVVDRADPLLGMGFPAPGSNPVDSRIYRYSADMTWIPILYYTGYGGLVLFGVLLAGFGLRGLRLATSTDEARRFLGQTYVITIALTVLVGFTAWTFMQPQIAPMGLWMLAFVAAEALKPAAEPVGAAVPAGKTLPSASHDLVAS